jgi:all-trans-retinol dehydrogenase (NAD+)
MTDIRDHRALVTGAASGIGRLLATKLAQAGGEVVLWDIDAEGLEQVRTELKQAGHRVDSYVCDLTDRQQIAAVAEQTLADGGPIDILVNNAGIVSGNYLLDIADEAIERTFQVNALAPFWTVRAFLPSMLERGSGHLVTIASAAGLAGTARLTDYCASKFAAVGFDEALRLELRQLDRRIRTTVVCPFFIDTGMFDGARARFSWLLPVLEPETVVRRIVTAIEKNRRRLVMPRLVYVTWPARLLPVGWFDGLMRFLGVSRSMDDFRPREG